MITKNPTGTQQGFRQDVGANHSQNMPGNDRAVNAFQMDERPRIESVLGWLSADCDREAWFRCLAAIQNELGEDGRELARSWSAEWDGYSESRFNETWRSCSQGGGIGVATLYHLAREAGWTDDVDVCPMSQEQAEARRRSREEAAQKNREAEARNRERAKVWTAAIMAAFPPAKLNPYLERKQVFPMGSLLSGPVSDVERIIGYMPTSNGNPLQGDVLIVPCLRDFNPIPCTFQIIDPTGAKVWPAGGGVGIWPTAPFPAPGTQGLWFVVGEGVATVLSAAQAVQDQGVIGVSAGSNGQLPKTAQALRERYPDARITILADLKKDTGEADPKAVEAAQLVNGNLAVPSFSKEVAA